MSAQAIEVVELGKLYQLGGYERYETIRENITRSVKNVLRLRSGRADGADTFWALRGASFDIPHGQIVGIVGRNGAGKSTLLKILSRITMPTEGRARLHGRVGSLLEVGVGFHPELTGRENIFLNGAILGMRRTEIRAKFDEIVAFAEIDRFLDTPVKRYSSGMYVRLAFSVAAHLEPEILLVDEVLAVGDAAFQKKCLGKMGAVAREGRTIIFVSHNMVAVTALCERGILLQGGRLVEDGPAGQIVDRYLRETTVLAETSLSARDDRRGTGLLRFVGFEIRDDADQVVPHVASGQTATLTFHYEAAPGAMLNNVKVAIGVHGKFDEALFHLSTTTVENEFASLPARGSIRCRVERLPLQPGSYTFNLFCTVGEDVADWLQNAGTITVEPGDFFRSGRMPPPEQGPYLIDHSWFSVDDQPDTAVRTAKAGPS